MRLRKTTVLLALPLACLLACLSLVGGVPALAAQRQTVKSLAGRLQGVEKDLEAIKQFLAHEEVDRGGLASPGPEDSRALAAETQVRINAVEVELQALTGQIEQAGHRLGLLSERLEKLVADVEFRLAALERAGDRAGAGGSDRPPPEAGVAATDSPGAARKSAATPSEPPSQAMTEPYADMAPEALYETARGKLRAEDYDGAGAAFEAFLTRFPDHQLAANAQYWLGHSFYQRRLFEDAARAFLNGYEKYGDSPKAADSLLKLGMTLFALGDAGQACDVYKEFSSRFDAPQKRLADLLSAQTRRAGCK